MSAQPERIDTPPMHMREVIYEHLDYELRKLDLLVLRKTVEFRHGLRNNPRTRAGTVTYVSDEEIDWLLIEPEQSTEDANQVESIDDKIAKIDDMLSERLADWIDAGTIPPLLQLARRFGLSRFEATAVVICLAPELRRKYDRIYAYLQDDITRQRPSADLILQLCCRHERQRWQLRSSLTAGGTLMRAGILQPVNDGQSPSGSSDLSRFLQLDPRILNFALGNDAIDARIQDVAWVIDATGFPARSDFDDRTAKRIEEIVTRHLAVDSDHGSKVLIHLRGPRGVGKTEAARIACRILGAPLLILDAERIQDPAHEAAAIIKLACRESLLLQAPLLISRFDCLIGLEAQGRPLCARLAWLAAEFGWLTFVAGEKAWQPSNVCEPIAFETVRMWMPGVARRRQIWRSQLAHAYGSDTNVDVDELAKSYRLGAGQIRQVVLSTHLPAKNQAVDEASRTGWFARTCRDLSNQRMSEMATKVNAQYSWDDIVLPHDTIKLLHEICSQSRHQHRVMTDWGFKKKLPYGRGLSVLFSGPPGTGKTMAAQIIAHDLKLDLYKIDLSRVVSKYIGETEKNLSRIFEEADTSNAVIFFDEADALFGKRTEVLDAHDRYANIEVSYLLQRMEEYDGIVILATNLQKNMDDAFIRRIRFIVEYPFPDEESRHQIWRKLFPENAPMAGDIDFVQLSKKLKVTGGNIKNIVLNAAFRAAEDNRQICMQHIIMSARREFEKIGKLWRDSIIVDGSAAGVKEAV